METLYADCYRLVVTPYEMRLLIGVSEVADGRLVPAYTRAIIIPLPLAVELRNNLDDMVKAIVPAEKKENVVPLRPVEPTPAA